MKAFSFIIGLILAGFAAYHYVPGAAQAIENKVTENVTATLVPEGLPADVQINVDGRDVNLTGIVRSEEEKAKFAEMAQAVEGVKAVNSELTVVEQLPVLVVEESAVTDDDEIIFDPLGEEPLFNFLEDESEELEENIDVALNSFEESTADVAEEIEEAADDAFEAVEETAQEVEEMIEEPVIPAPQENTLEDAPEEETVEEENIVENETKKSASECQVEISVLVKGKRVNFETGQSKIDKSSLPLLDSIVEEMAGCEDMALHIHGHTDNVGEAVVNRKLSHSRAKSVGLYFLKKGVTQRIKIFGHGDDEPIASNDNEEGRKANRRIEFTVSDFDDSVAGDDEDTVKTKRVPRLIKEHTIIAP